MRVVYHCESRLINFIVSGLNYRGDQEVLSPQTLISTGMNSIIVFQ